jgi:hypothetical protein
MSEPGDTYYVGAYWLARQETAESCASRAAALFQRLAACEPCFARWFRKGYSLSQALKHPIDTQRDALLRRFLRPGGRRKDECSLRVWNGETAGAGASLAFSCGSPSAVPGNSCILSLAPEEALDTERLVRASVFQQVLRAMVLACDPEWGVATSDLLRDRLSETGKAGTFVGWATYFSRHRGSIPPLPAPVQVEPVEDKGTLVILTPERVSISNPAHLELAHRVTETLARAGLLRPLRAWEG